MDLRKIINKYIEAGYAAEDAESKVAQDVILLAITGSRFSENLTIKGGVVMHSISNNMRRATRDMDLDFIKYSLSDKSIENFVKELNRALDGVSIQITGGIKPLQQQDYDGKRVHLRIIDDRRYTLITKLDIGVHKDFDIEQDEYCFNLDVIGVSAKLLINSKEQIFTEKLKSLLKHGARSTRYKDLFDFYYLITETTLDKDRLKKCIDILILKDSSMREENMTDVVSRLNSIFLSNLYRSHLTTPKVNWLDVSVDDAIGTVSRYIETL